jgi:hypothetical protein
VSGLRDGVEVGAQSLSAAPERHTDRCAAGMAGPVGPAVQLPGERMPSTHARRAGAPADRPAPAAQPAAAESAARCRRRAGRPCRGAPGRETGDAGLPQHPVSAAARHAGARADGRASGARGGFVPRLAPRGCGWCSARSPSSPPPAQPGLTDWPHPAQPPSHPAYLEIRSSILSDRVLRARTPPASPMRSTPCLCRDPR